MCNMYCVNLILFWFKFVVKKKLLKKKAYNSTDFLKRWQFSLWNAALESVISVLLKIGILLRTGLSVALMIIEQSQYCVFLKVSRSTWSVHLLTKLPDYKPLWMAFWHLRCRANQKLYLQCLVASVCWCCGAVCTIIWLMYVTSTSTEPVQYSS